KNLLAVSATPARTHAVLVLLRFKLRTSDQNKTGCRKNIETLCRVLTASLPLGLSRLVHWLRLIPAKLAPSHTGPNTCIVSRSGRGPEAAFSMHGQTPDCSSNSSPRAASLQPDRSICGQRVLQVTPVKRTGTGRATLPRPTMSQGRLPILISRSENQHSARWNRVDEGACHRAIKFDRHRTAIRIEQVDAPRRCIRPRVD